MNLDFCETIKTNVAGNEFFSQTTYERVVTIATTVIEDYKLPNYGETRV